MEQRNNTNHGNEVIVVDVDDDVMLLPGFRFHPTDEELVGFYLKRKIQHRPLSIQLITQLDIYKYDPWDLPKLARTGEKEWYFFCQRDRKYRNSARPNRVTAAGFWKATGTDRPVYSNSNCIGLKKSLVFYTGRASKALKTDWMMHEFRLPNSPTSIPPNESWAICRIFKKTNISAAQRSAVSCSLPRDEIIYKTNILDDIDENGLVESSKTTSNVPFSTTLPHNLQTSYDPFDYLEGKLPQLSIPNDPFGPPTFTFEPMEVSDIAKSAMDVSSILLNMSPSLLGDEFCSSRPAESSDPFEPFQAPYSFSPPTTLPHEMQDYDKENALLLEKTNPWESVSVSSPSPIGYPLSCIWDKLLKN